MSPSVIARRVKLPFASSLTLLFTLGIMLLTPLGLAAQDPAGIMTGPAYDAGAHVWQAGYHDGV